MSLQSRAKKSSKHKFTKVFGQATAQSDIFEETCLPLLAPVMRQENYNALLFAYGVSNSGKTHTVLGSSQPGQAGILPRALAVVFRSIDTFIQDSGEAAQYRPIGFQDIYTEKIHDLLAEPPESLVPGLGALSPKRPALHMQTDQTTGQKYIHGLRDIKVRTLEEALLVLRAGLRQRQVFSTLLNNVSSRSHCVFTIKILKTPQFGNSAAETAAKGKTSVSRLSIVDLAGSERVRNTNSTGQRRREAGNINNSLMVLGHCMEVLRLNQIGASKVPQMVPYRHSKLTQLFQGVLDGKSKNSKMCLIINVNPFQNEFDETIQSLRFSSVAMNV
ncbi:kinesin motor domain-containing protein, partial [Gamsiella multidivaricata]|uniref:kinesin motor domain-containing protein n=1 Tax=Gamsiella multidivaricata TaxID=101098 RepID=UPI0022212A7F